MEGVEGKCGLVADTELTFSGGGCALSHHDARGVLTPWWKMVKLVEVEEVLLMQPESDGSPFLAEAYLLAAES